MKDRQKTWKTDKRNERQTEKKRKTDHKNEREKKKWITDKINDKNTK